MSSMLFSMLFINTIVYHGVTQLLIAYKVRNDYINLYPEAVLTPSVSYS
jgi:hypothetical protein